MDEASFSMGDAAAMQFSTDGSDGAAPACCSNVVSCKPDAAGGSACCPPDGGDAGVTCCVVFAYGCSPGSSNTLDGGEAGVVCGCWPMFV